MAEEKEKDRYISLAEVKEMLMKASKSRDLNYEQKIALQHAQHCVTLPPDEIKKIVAELKKIPNINDAIAYKIADIMPTHPDDVKLIFAKQRFTIEQTDIEKILEIMRKYL
jgi:DNA-directed RNA polymerase subunit F